MTCDITGGDGVPAFARTREGRAVGEPPTEENVVWCESHPYPFDKLRAGLAFPIYTPIKGEGNCRRGTGYFHRKIYGPERPCKGGRRWEGEGVPAFARTQGVRELQGEGGCQIRGEWVPLREENVVWCESHPYPFDKLRAVFSLPHLYTHQGGRELQARNGLFS